MLKSLVGIFRRSWVVWTGNFFPLSFLDLSKSGEPLLCGRVRIDSLGDLYARTADNPSNAQAAPRAELIGRIADVLDRFDTPLANGAFPVDRFILVDWHPAYH